jgi:hypothetical protein
MFEPSNAYHQLNAGAHRNISKHLKAPALTWHLGFLINNGLSQDRIKRGLDNFIIELLHSFKDDKTGQVSNVTVSPCISDVILLFNNTLNKSDFSIYTSSDDVPLSQTEKNVLF